MTTCACGLYDYDFERPVFTLRVAAERPREIHFSGEEHGINAQIYLAEDEPTFDIDIELDAVAHQRWQEEQIEEEAYGW